MSGVSGRAQSAATAPRHGIDMRTTEFTRTFQSCGNGYANIVSMLEHPQETNEQQVLPAITRLRRLCTSVSGTLAGDDTTHFRKPARDAEGAIRAYRSSLVHLALYARTQSLSQLEAAQLGFIDASSKDLRAQREINACRAAAGIAPLPLADHARDAGLEPTTI